MPPLRDAVRLVDHEQADPGLPDPLEEARATRTARARRRAAARAPGHGAVERRAVRRRVLLRVDERDRAGRDALQRLDLVLHQRHERRDDEREVGAHQRGQLVAERLARAGRHHDEHVAPGDRGVDRLALARAGSAGKPNTSRSAASGSVARANGSGGSGPRPGQRGRDQRIGDERGGHGRTTIARGPVATGGVLAALSRSRHEVGADDGREAGADVARNVMLRAMPASIDPRPPRRGPRPRGGASSRAARGARAELTARARRHLPDGVADGVDGRALRPPPAVRRPRRRLPLHRRRRQRVRRLQPGRPERRPAASRRRPCSRRSPSAPPRGLQFLLPVEEGIEAAELLAERYGLPGLAVHPLGLRRQRARRSGSPATAPAATCSSSSAATTTAISTTRS